MTMPSSRSASWRPFPRGARDQAARGEVLEHLHRHVLAHAETGKIDSLGAIGAERENAGGERVARRAGSTVRPSQNTWPSAVSRPPRARSASRWPLPSAPAKPSDLAAVRRSRVTSEKRGPAESASPRSRRSPSPMSAGSAGNPMSIEPADHQRDQIVLRKVSSTVVRALLDAVAQDGDAVGEVEDLGQAVADIDHRRCPPTDPARMIPVSLATSARSRVEVGSSSSSTLGSPISALTISRNWRCGRGETADQGVGRDGEIVGARAGAAAQSRASPSGGAPRRENQVLRDGELADQRVVLVDGGEAELAGRAADRPP